MIKVNMIPVNSILKDVYLLMREHDVLEDLVMEFAIRGMEFLTVYKTYEKAVCFVPIKNNQGEFPHGVIGIEGVIYKIGPVTPKEINVILDAHVDVRYNQEHALIGRDLNIKLAPFKSVVRALESGWSHLPISNNTFDRSILCNPEYAGGSCGDWWMPDSSNNRFITSFDEGYLGVAYYRYPQDEDGNFLIPDYPIIHEAIESYVLMKIYQRLWHASKQGAESKFKYYEAKWQLLSAAAKGEMMMLSLPDYINLNKQNKLFRDHAPEKVYGGWGNEHARLGNRTGYGIFNKRI